MKKIENICKEFYSTLDDDKNKINQDSINNFQEYDLYKEINEGKNIKLNDILGSNIKVSEKNEIKEENKETINEINTEEKKVTQKENEEDEEEGEEVEEVDEEEENK